MRVSIIAHGLSDGGAERVASIVANYLSKEDKVQFIAVYNNEKVYKLQEKVEYRYVNVEKQKSKKRKFIDRCLIIKKYIKDFRPDIIISFIYKETLLLNKTNIIYTLRIDPKASENNFIEKNMRKIFYEKSRGVIFQTVDAMNYFSKKIKNKSAVIYNPIEVNKLPKWEEKEHNKSIITACRLSRQKNIPMLIEAFEQIKSEYDDFIVEIYGDGPEKNNIQNLINQKNLNNKIFLRGYYEGQTKNKKSSQRGRQYHSVALCSILRGGHDRRFFRRRKCKERARYRRQMLPQRAIRLYGRRKAFRGSVGQAVGIFQGHSAGQPLYRRGRYGNRRAGSRGHHNL